MMVSQRGEAVGWIRNGHGPSKPGLMQIDKGFRTFTAHPQSRLDARLDGADFYGVEKTDTVVEVSPS